MASSDDDRAAVERQPASAAAAQSRSRWASDGARGAPPAFTGREGKEFLVGPRVTRAARADAYERTPNAPLYRPLRVYALDPSAARRDGAQAVVSVPYEALEVGPSGSVLEILEPVAVDLDEPAVLLQQGHAPSPNDPRFRAQMVYAVCSTTYAAFRQALGRQLAWGFDRGPADGARRRLRVRPSASALRNAYYDRLHGELCFGSFPADGAVQGANVPHGTIHTALSHDIVVHEMAHALLDGLRAHFMLPTNADVLAFHEAFADLVALFQRFTYADVVRAGLRHARGDLTRPGLLTEIATQFGETTGLRSALRSAVRGTEFRYGIATEPHELGAVLVAAVFAAFARVVSEKTRRFVRLATGGTGALPPGDMPDQLLELLVREAQQVASQFLSICIRAVDYCPPVDLRLGEYLRAVITADFDLVPDDPWGYREAWVEGFRRFGILPPGVDNLSQDSLLWRGPRVPDEPAGPIDDLAFANLRFRGDPGRPAGPEELLRQARALGALVGMPEYRAAFGCARRGDSRLRGDAVDPPVIESVRTSRRVGPDGQVVFDLVAEVTQRRHVARTADLPGFALYGGATVILDPEGRIRYLIGRANLSDERVEQQRAYLRGAGQRFWGVAPGGRLLPEAQLFRLVHETTREAGHVPPPGSAG
ncbi:MAG TPA: hypothetical protein VFY16_10380 [Gemmatimonadaceae bacterium]|nr:hypothetical protein [Gemmatimonadaceae bacterium]